MQNQAKWQSLLLLRLALLAIQVDLRFENWDYYEEEEEVKGKNEKGILNYIFHLCHRAADTASG